MTTAPLPMRAVDSIAGTSVSRVVLAVLLLVAVGCARRQAPAAAPVAVLPPPPVLYLHFPGISGPMPGDRALARAMVASGVAPAVEIVDWTMPSPGVGALGNLRGNHAFAKTIADRIAALVRKDPRAVVILSGHSGGTGIVVWTLEALPDDVKVDRVLLLAGAVSVDYDLSLALRHVRTKLWNFYSPGDHLVLGTLTRNFGTIDRVKSDACGFLPFLPPPTADATAYKKLAQVPYDPAWESLGHDSGHMGSLQGRFVSGVLAPLLQTGDLSVSPDTRPKP